MHFLYRFQESNQQHYQGNNDRESQKLQSLDNSIRFRKNNNKKGEVKKNYHSIMFSSFEEI